MADQSPANPIRIAIAGAGIYARDAHVPSLFQLCDRFEIVAVYSRTKASAAALAQQIGGTVDVYTNPEELLARSDIEAVDIVLPIPVQPAIVEAALRSGKHVMSEKPIAPTSEAAYRLMKIHDQHIGQVWMVAENWRYEEAFERAAGLLAEGAIGRHIAVQWTNFARLTPDHKYYQTAWRRSGSFPGGFLLDVGVHHIAALRLLLGDIESVTGMVDQISPDLPPADTMCAAMRFADGTLGAYFLSFGAGSAWDTPLTIVGERGSLRVQRGRIDILRGGVMETIECERLNGVRRELAAFADAVRHGEPHRNTPDEGLRDLEVIEAILRAADNRRTQFLTTV